MRFSLAKYAAYGNDFVLVDNRSGDFPLSFDWIRRICRRQEGGGADGVILLERSVHADFGMRIFNSDGTEAAMCGNGLLCLAAWLEQLGSFREGCQVHAMRRLLNLSRSGRAFCLDIGPPSRVEWGISLERQGAYPSPWKSEDLGIANASGFNPLKADAHSSVDPCADAESRELPLKPQIDSLTRFGISPSVDFLDTGVPHAVLFVPDVERIDVPKAASFIRHHPRWQPEGTNVNFVQLTEGSTLHLRTYERGVEGETLACGTGAVAAALAAAYRHRLSSPIAIRTRLGEGPTVEFNRRQDSFFDVMLVGEASRMG